MRFRARKSERKAIRWALRFKDPWAVDSKSSPVRKDRRAKEVTNFKRRLKEFHLLCQDNCCCYCKSELTGRNIETDREHIIPKDDVRSQTFNPYNLSVACKTCNMTFKGTKKTHIRGWRRFGRTLHKDILDERNYNVVHPNIHYWHDHIDLLSEQSKGISVRIYFPTTRRGRFTYDLLGLKEREVYRNREAQKGRPTRERGIHPEIRKAAQENFQIKIRK